MQRRWGRRPANDGASILSVENEAEILEDVVCSFAFELASGLGHGFGKRAESFERLWSPSAANCFNDHRDKEHPFSFAVGSGVQMKTFYILVRDNSSSAVVRLEARDSCRWAVVVHH